MTLLVENPHSFCFVVSETEGPFRSRDAVSVALNQALLPGQVLGSIGTPGTMTASAAADADNAGNGTLTLDATAPIAPQAKDGAYRVVFTAPTAFTVTDPAGKEVGKGVVGTAFAKDVKFLIAAGGNAFAANDAFSVTVGREAILDEQYVALNLAATDGSQFVKAIAGHRVIASATAVQTTTVFNGPGEVRGSDLIWPAGITVSQKAEAVQQLRALGIKVR